MSQANTSLVILGCCYKNLFFCAGHNCKYCSAWLIRIAADIHGEGHTMFKFTNHRAFAVVALLVAGATTATADTLQKISISSTIHLGFRSNNVPFSYVDKSGNPQGYLVDICKKMALAVARELKIPQLKTTWIPVGPNERNSALNDGLIDIDCADSTVTTQSQKTVAFSVPVFVSSTRMVVSKQLSGNDLGVLSGKKFVTTSQAGNEAMLRYVLPQTGVMAEPVVVRTPKRALESLQSGASQAWFADDATLFAAQLKSKQMGELQVLPKIYSIRPKALTFRREDDRMRPFMLRQMRELISTGLLLKTYDQWLNAPLPDSGINLSVPLNYLLRESWKTPTDTYVDYS